MLPTYQRGAIALVAQQLDVEAPEPVVTSRLTRDGRCLWYQLSVVQLPERARACGAGPKSSADRRPVDPPPVVELRIFEGPSLDHAEDITFMYNANFFVFATLEHARVLANGRVQTPSATTPPVLTGMPFSGMAYLDRPREAGYFLFPDLSVRHEGRYRLSFNLFEQTKEPGDLDRDVPEASAPVAEFFDWRLEIKSNDFTVFSAKKFPGLTESTALSRTVAEQGCRVRIRRDVRMRRREGKGSAPSVNGDALSPEDEFRRHRTQTPESTRDFRARSLSNESMARTPFAPSGPDPNAALAQRRPSVDEYHQSPHNLQHHRITMSPPQKQQQQQLQQPAQQPMTPGFGASQAQPYYDQASPVPSSPTCVSSPYAQPPPSSPDHSAQHTEHQNAHPPQYTHHAQHHSSSSVSATPQSPQAPTPSQGYYHERSASRHYTQASTSVPVPMDVMSPTSVHAPSPRRESFSSIDCRHMSTSFPTPSSLVAEMAIDPSPDATRPMSPVLSSDTKATTSLPSLSEMFSFRNEKSEKVEKTERNDDQSSSSGAPGSSHSSMSLNSSSNGSDASGSPNSDRVPSLSQLLLPPPVVSTSPPNVPVAASVAQKKRVYDQYSNIDADSGYYTTEPAKNLARPQETVVQDFGEMCWKRADGTIWTMQGKMAMPRA